MLICGAVLADGEPPVDVRVVGTVVTDIEPAGSLRAAPREDVIEARGGALLPGFVDGHLHLTQWTAARTHIDIAAATSASDAVRLVVDAVSSGAVSSKAISSELLRASGFRDALWSDVPHKDLLEHAFPGRRVALSSMDLHTLWMSPALLADLKFDHATGVVRDQECIAAMAALSDRECVADVDAAAMASTDALARMGITSIVDFEYADNIENWTRRSRIRLPGVTVHVSIWPAWLSEALGSGHRTGDIVDGGGGLIHIGPLKVMVDGSLNTRTACCHDPYPGSPEHEAHGLLLVESEELESLMATAWRGGISSAVHAIGDRANSLVLDAFERVGCGGRIEHAQQIRAQDLRRFVRPDLIVSVQPQHAVADRDVADALWAESKSKPFAYGSLQAVGARVRFGSDAPVSPPDPLASVADAVFRTDDDRSPWHTDESMTLPAALAAVTGGRGRIHRGDPADLVLLAEHPLRLGNRDLRQVPVLATVSAGRITHQI